jgi:serine/threonine protein phosphatase PrpC
MSAEEAEKAPQAHGITRWLGADAGENAQPDVTQATFAVPGYLLLCTDGLWNYAQAAEQLGALVQGGETIEIARKLIDYANGHGGHDNITAVLLRIHSSGNE